MTPRLLWLASYPKSGNTWLRMALTSLQAGGAAIDINHFSRPGDIIASSRLVFDAALDIESSDLTAAEITAARRDVFFIMARRRRETAIWKVHEACIDVAPGLPLFPPEVTAGAIYLARDPRDVAVSFSHHFAIDLDTAIARLADPAHVLAPQRRGLSPHLPQPLLDWSGHVESWLDRPPFPVTLLRYEDMVADPAAALGRAARTAGFAADPAAIDRAVAATRFESLRDQERAAGFDERPAEAALFFRQGRHGGWRDSLTPAQADAIVAAHGRVMARLGYL